MLVSNYQSSVTLEVRHLSRLQEKVCHLRDPLHGFIDLSPLEMQIVDSPPFQRLRLIHQLALTHLVYHGAEHTRFGHSLGTLHLATRAFHSVVGKCPGYFTPQQQRWYLQILRLMALTHDLGHAPFSHASGSLFLSPLEHEDYTVSILMAQPISEYIQTIGQDLSREMGSEYNITPELIADVYTGKTTDPHLIFLRKFMDSELDCDKMDYLLRDSYYCGVQYGKYDLDRLLESLTIYEDEDGTPRLAIKAGGVHAVEGFIVARYFMFLQVYFHKTRRLYDKMLTEFLAECLDGGKYPANLSEYLVWNDHKVWSLIETGRTQSVWADRIYNRKLMRLVYESPPHSTLDQRRHHNLIVAQLNREFSGAGLFTDAADKLPHKLPARYNVDDEKAIAVIRSFTDVPISLSEQSEVIKNLTTPINVLRIYVPENIYSKATGIVDTLVRDMNSDPRKGK